MIAGISLLDAIAKSAATYDGEPPAELEVGLANELIAAALDEYRRIEALDACGPRKKWRRLYVRETESAMRRIHEDWLAGAGPLLQRVREMKRAGRRIEQYDEFTDAVGLARTHVGTTVDDIERGRQQVRRGEAVTLEEIKRELRVPSRR